MSSASSAIEYLDKRLATIDTAPGTWGSPESLELQALLLLEVRTFLLRPRQHAQNPFEVRSSYVRFIRSHIRNATAESMAVQLERQGRVDELPRLLGQFRDRVIKQFVPEQLSTAASVTHEPTESRHSTMKVPRGPWRDAIVVSQGLRVPPRMGSVSAGVDA